MLLHSYKKNTCKGKCAAHLDLGYFQSKVCNAVFQGLATAAMRSIHSSSGGLRGWGLSLWWAWGRVGMEGAQHAEPHAELRAGVMGSRQLIWGLRVPDVTMHSWQRWGNSGIVHKQVRQLHTGNPHEKPFRGQFPNPGRRGIRNLSLTNPWNIPPNKLTGIQDTTGSRIEHMLFARASQEGNKG